jgi:hypothetical protein
LPELPNKNSRLGTGNVGINVGVTVDVAEAASDGVRKAMEVIVLAGKTVAAGDRDGVSRLSGGCVQLATVTMKNTNPAQIRKICIIIHPVRVAMLATMASNHSSVHSPWTSNTCKQARHLLPRLSTQQLQPAQFSVAASRLNGLIPLLLNPAKTQNRQASNH